MTPQTDGLEPIELSEEIQRLLEARQFRAVRDRLMNLRGAEVAELLGRLEEEQRAIVFRILPSEVATESFECLAPDEQRSLLLPLGTERFGVLLNGMEPDDRTALLETFPPQAARKLVSLLSKEERNIALRLLGYPESSVGRLMTPNYIAVPDGWNVEEVFRFIRTHGSKSDAFEVVFVLAASGQLADDLPISDLLLADPQTPLSELMNHKFLALQATDDQEEAVAMFKKYDRSVLPVINPGGYMLGVVTVDDVLHVAEEEATEDIQKFGGTEALEEPYLRAPLATLIKKRAKWLIVLFIGEMLTASAMGFFEYEIKRAVVLALFIPLIISSGGNSGSQAATLVIRALAVGEATLRDWFKVLYRELVAGICLGLLLGLIGFIRIAVWSQFGNYYGEHWFLVGVSVMVSLIGVVLWGAVSGAMLPFVIKRLGADPAVSSAPFVATIVDVTGLVLYFSIAAVILGDVLL